MMRAWFPVLTGLLLAASVGGLEARPPQVRLLQQPGPLDNPVFVDDSPVAYELFRRAQDQVRDNAGEAARLCQELLDDYPLRLVPASEAARDHFTAVRGRVLRLLRSDRALLDRHRALETPEAQRLLAAGELERLAVTRPLTGPGLEALLRLAQAELERGRFKAALDRLDAAVTHPDLDARRAAHAWHMRGMSARYLGDSARAFEAIDALTEIEREAGEFGGGAGAETAALREHLERLVGRDLPMPVEGASPLDRTSVAGLTELVPERIWETPLNDSLHARRMSDETAERHPLARPRRPGIDGGLLAAAATIAGDIVYINQGHTVTAHDRFTGSPAWPQPFVDMPSRAVIDRGDEQAMDLNIVAVSSDGDRLVTLTGHAHTAMRSSDGRVVCLDARTGALRWSRRLDRLDGAAELEGLFPHGAPVVAEGAVHVLARKVSPQSLTSTYLVTLDLDSGATKWARHVVSSGSQLRAPRAFSTLVHEAGDLYINDGVGAIARIEASSGQMRWLVRSGVPINPTPQERTRRPWEIMGPAIVVADSGDRLLALQPGMRSVLVLDRETGELLAVHDAATREGWNGPAYLLTSGRMVYAVGREVRAFHIANLEAPLWRLEDRSRVEDVGEGRAERRGRGTDPFAPIILGRVQVVEGALIVPTDDGLLIVNDETGEVMHRLDVEPGNPVAADSQVVVAGLDRLDAYMSLARAEALLRERIAAYPQDPEPALALLRLAGRAPAADAGDPRQGNLPLALDAADHAWEAIKAMNPGERARAARHELFGMLLELHELGAAGPTQRADAERLYATLEQIAQSAEQRLAQRIAHGDWLATADPGRAADLLHQLLADRDLVLLHREEGGVVRPASAWVTQRLGGLLARHGAELFAARSSDAESLVREAMQAGDADPLELIQLAEKHPFASSSMDAALEAAQRLLARGEARHAREALALVMRIYRGTSRDGRLSRGQSDRLLATAAAAREAAGWSARAERDSARLPAIGPQHGEAEVLLGWPLRKHPFATDRANRPDLVLVMDRTRMSLLLAPELRLAWTADIAAGAPGTRTPAGAPELLDATDEGILLWYGSDTEDPRAVMLDAADGSRKWITPRLSDHLRDPMAFLGRTERMPSGEPFDPRGWIPLADDAALAIVSRTGAVAGFDPDSASQPRWTRQETLDQVHLAEMRDGLLVLAGMQRQPISRGRAVLAPAVVALDARTGEPIHHSRSIQPIFGTGVTWMRLAPDDVGGGGLLLCASEAGLQVIDLFTGECLGANVSDAAAGAKRGVFIGDTLVFEDVRGTLRSFDPVSLAVSAPFEPPPTGEWGAASLVALLPAPAPPAQPGGEARTVAEAEPGPAVFAHYPVRIVRYAVEGAVRGVDVVRDDRSYRWLLPGEGGLVVVSAAAPALSGRRAPQIYRLYLLSHDCRLLDDAVQLPALPEALQEARLVDGWLLLSTSAGTLAVPMPERGER